MIAGLGIATAAVSAAIVFFSPKDFTVAILSAVAMGMVVQPLYAIAVAHAFDHAAAEDFVATSSGMLLSFGIGSIIGPLAASMIMSNTGPSGLYIMIIGSNILMVIFILARVLTRQAPTAEEKTDFEYASTAQVGSVISAEPLDAAAEEYVIAPEDFPAYEDDIYNFESSSDAEAEENNASVEGTETEEAPDATADKTTPKS